MLTNNQMISLFEDSDIGVEDIAEQFDCEVESVKMALASGSSKYREMVKKGDETFGEDTLEAAKRAIGYLIEDSDCDSVKLKAAIYVVDESKGRHTVQNFTKNVFNVNMINDQMRRANEAIRAVKDKININKQTVIELEAVEIR